MVKTLIVICGPTGVGKTDLAIDVAQELKTEIISADSRQIYKEMTIGTAVPGHEQLKMAPHHFIQNKTIHEYYNASNYEFEVIALLGKLFKKYNQVILVGGSGLYIDAVCYGIDDLPTIDAEIRENLINRFDNEGIESLRKELKVIDPEYYNKVDLKNPKRILKALEVYLMTGKPYSSFLKMQKKTRNFSILKIGLNMDRNKLYSRINERVDKMFIEGLEAEAKNLYQYKNNIALKTVGYRELFEYFENKTDLKTTIDLIKRNTRHYARKQITWFNKYKDLTWFSPDEGNDIINYILNETKK